MALDDQSSALDRRDESRRRKLAPRGLFSLFVAVFAVGGVYFGYVFVATTISLLTGAPAPPAASLLPGNPFQPSARATPAPDEPGTPALPDWKGDERLNVLLLGVDQRDDERGRPVRTDTVILATVDPLAKTAALVHIPRDLWVVIPGHGENKINTANFFGDLDRPGSGPVLAKQTIETAFGVRMHYYARVDFRGFERAIDALGGVTIDAPKPVKDDEYPDGDYGVRRIYVPAGIQHLDGRVALQYARSRHADNDLGRGKRQTQLLIAARNQAARLDILPKLPFLVGVLRDAIGTDVPAGDWLPLLNLARQIDSQNVVNHDLGPTMFDDLYGDGTVLMPKWNAIRQLMAEVFYDPKVRAERATVAVQNGTLRDGLAAGMGAALAARGYQVKSVSQAARSDYAETVIIDHSGKPNTVRKLAALLRVGVSNIRSEPGQSADITLVLGLDAKIPN